MDTSGSREETRLRHRPPDVRVLFVGESPPANGTFFYMENSNLWRYTREAFQSVYGDVCFTGARFCEFFKSTGCYVEDLCLEPVNHMNDAKRRQVCRAAVGSLAERMSVLAPHVAVCVKMSVASYVRSAMFEAGLQVVPFHLLPFPSCGHQREYVEGLAKLMRMLQVNAMMTQKYV